MMRGLIRHLIHEGIIDPAPFRRARVVDDPVEVGDTPSGVFGGHATMPSPALERLREAAILEANLDNVRFIPCASRLHAGHPQHEAHWHMRCPCGGVLPVCNERREALKLSDGMHCNTVTCRCEAYHRFAEITWTRI